MSNSYYLRESNIYTMEPYDIYQAVKFPLLYKMLA